MSQAGGGKLIIDIDGDTKDLENALDRLDSVGSAALGALAAGFAALGAGFTVASGKSLQLASDLQEVQNVVDVTFSEGAKQIQEFADAAGDTFGLSELQAKKYSSTLGAMMKSMGLTSDQVLDMSQNLTGLSGDFASFYNLDHQTAFDKIRSGLSGETEPLMQLGINMQVASLEAYALSKGIQTAFKDMTAAEKAILRYNYLLESSADAQGDFARTSEGYANQLRIAGMEVETLGVAFGEILLPIATDALGEIIDSVKTLSSEFSTSGLSAAVAGLGQSFSNISVGALSGLSSALPTLISSFTTLLNNLDFLALAMLTLKANSLLTSTAFKTFATSLTTTNTQMVGGIMMNVSRMSTLLPAIGTAARGAGTALLGAFGGPVGAAVTALALGIGYLATRESEADAAARELAEAQSLVTEALDDSKKSAEEFSDALGEAAQLSRELAKEKATEALSAQWDVLTSKIQEAIFAQQDWLQIAGLNLEENKAAAEQMGIYAGTIEQLRVQLNNGEIDSKQFLDVIALFIKQLESGDPIAQEFAKSLREMFDDKFFHKVAEAHDALKSVVDLQREAEFVGPPEPEREDAPAGGAGGGGSGTTTTNIEYVADRIEERINRLKMSVNEFSLWKIRNEMSKLREETPQLTEQINILEQSLLQAERARLSEELAAVSLEIAQLKEVDANMTELQLNEHLEKMRQKLPDLLQKTKQLKNDIANVDAVIADPNSVTIQADTVQVSDSGPSKPKDGNGESEPAEPPIEQAAIGGYSSAITAETDAAIQEVKDKWTGSSEDIGMTISASLGTAITSALSGEKSWGDAFADMGKNLITSLADSLMDTANNLLTQAITSVANIIIGGFSGSMGIASPSKVFQDFGYWIDAGLAKGIEENAPMTISPFTKMRDGMQSALSGLSMENLQATFSPSMVGTPALAAVSGNNQNNINFVVENNAPNTKVEQQKMRNANGQVEMKAVIVSTVATDYSNRGRTYQAQMVDTSKNRIVR